jgi:nitroreductase
MYKPEAVPKELIDEIIEAACWAPSGKNGQPWKFTVIANDEALKEKVCSLSVYKNWLKTAPCLIAVFMDKSLSYDYNKDMQAIGAAIQNMLLAAHGLGLGTCWVGEILKHKKEIEALLEVPEHFELMAVVALGYKRLLGNPPKRKGLSEVVYSWK